jgi:hypothetical protein
VASHPGMLLAYDDDGNVIAWLDYMVIYDETPERNPIGLADFLGHEEQGKPFELADGGVWHVEGAAGSKPWPEYLAGSVMQMRVEKEGKPGSRRIAALVHRKTRKRRDRAKIEARIERVMKRAAKRGEPADLRAIVGGPTRPVR